MAIVTKGGFSQKIEAKTSFDMACTCRMANQNNSTAAWGYNIQLLHDDIWKTIDFQLAVL
ncbi:MAG TPA: hypothetical protein EYH10_00410 [Deltaproteobacteria bacterium]|nr:hypothetical protein [Deltaproteobacteria bacterium]